MAPLPPVSRIPSPQLHHQQSSPPAPSQGLLQLQQQQQQQQQHTPPILASADNDRSSGELRAVDCNLASLCDHIQMEGFNAGAFFDVVVQAMGATYRLHRLILSRSAYFRNMLHGPWKEAGSPTIVLQIDDPNVNSEAIATGLAYLYGHHPKLNDKNAFRVLAAASFLDLQDLCAICTDFIISELWTSNFLAYQVFAESQDYGIHGERVRNACWGYLCQSATTELREVLPQLSSQTLHALLTSDELWVPNEEKRFELALYALLAKAAMSEVQHSGEESSGSEKIATSDSPRQRQDVLCDYSSGKRQMDSAFHNLTIEENLDGCKATHNMLAEFADYRGEFYTNFPSTRPIQRGHAQSMQDPRCSVQATTSSPTDTSAVEPSCSCMELQDGAEITRIGGTEVAVEGPSGESSCYQTNNSVWSRESMASTSTNGSVLNDWGRCNMPSWGGRTVGRRQVKNSSGGPALPDEEYDAFVNIFEGGSLLYCNMSFEALLNVRRQLEELGFPCKAVNDGLWLQMLLCHRVQAVVADTCQSCCLASNACQCRQVYGCSHGSSPVGYYRQENNRNSTSTMGNMFITDAQGDGSGLFGPVRVHVRGAIDGLAGIGRGTPYAAGAAWPPTRYVFSRVPFGLGNRNCQQSLANDEPETRIDLNGDLPGDGLTALVGLSQGNNVIHVHAEQTERIYEADSRNILTGSASQPNTGGIAVQILEAQEHPIGVEWENSEGTSISLDLKTPLRHFPPFRFGVEFRDVHRLIDGQVKHSPEVFYAGSLWKVSVQAFSDEDPQGRRTLGLFLHRRKAEMTDSLRKIHMYVDSREKVTTRYQLICPSKREVMVFGSFKQAGTLLPKAPKGWGWRTALLFDELADLLQGGALRVAAVVQLV